MLNNQRYNMLNQQIYNMSNNQRYNMSNSNNLKEYSISISDNLKIFKAIKYLIPQLKTNKLLEIKKQDFLH